MNVEEMKGQGGLNAKIISFLVFACMDLGLTCYYMFSDFDSDLSKMKGPNSPMNGWIIMSVVFYGSAV